MVSVGYQIFNVDFKIVISEIMRILKQRFTLKIVMCVPHFPPPKMNWLFYVLWHDRDLANNQLKGGFGISRHHCP